MNDFARTVSDLFQLGGKIAHLYTKRVLTAQKECVLSASV